MKKQIKKSIPLYVLMLPAMIYLLLFNYVPMYGVQIAFKDYRLQQSLGIKDPEFSPSVLPSQQGICSWGNEAEYLRGNGDEPSEDALASWEHARVKREKAQSFCHAK